MSSSCVYSYMMFSNNILNVFVMISPITSLFQVMLLVEAGADAGAIDEEGNNSLHIATRYI